jgi:hypothetical protein
MGMTIQAELHYGYDLGDNENGNGWAFAETSGEYDETIALPWFDEGGDSLGEQAMDQLRKAAGFIETDWRADSTYFDRRRELDAQLGVEFQNTGYEGARTLLVAKGIEITAYTSEVELIDPALLAAGATDAMDQALANALQVLGITPKQEKPAWLLTCYYG